MSQILGSDSRAVQHSASSDDHPRSDELDGVNNSSAAREKGDSAGGLERLGGDGARATDMPTSSDPSGPPPSGLPVNTSVVPSKRLRTPSFSFTSSKVGPGPGAGTADNMIDLTSDTPSASSETMAAKKARIDRHSKARRLALETLPWKLPPFNNNGHRTKLMTAIIDFCRSLPQFADFRAVPTMAQHIELDLYATAISLEEYLAIQVDKELIDQFNNLGDRIVKPRSDSITSTDTTTATTTVSTAPALQSTAPSSSSTLSAAKTVAGPVVGGVRDLNGTVNISSSLGQSESSSVHSKEIKIEQNCSSSEEIELALETQSWKLPPFNNDDGHRTKLMTAIIDFCRSLPQFADFRAVPTMAQHIELDLYATAISLEEYLAIQVDKELIDQFNNLGDRIVKPRSDSITSTDTTTATTTVSTAPALQSTAPSSSSTLSAAKTVAGPVVGGVRDLNGTVNISSSLGQSESSSVHSKEIKIEQNCSSLEEIEKRNRVSIEKDKKIERGRMTMKNESASAKTAASILNLPWRSESALVDPCRLTQMKIILKHFKNKIMQLRQTKKIDVEAIQKKVQKIEYGLFTRALSLEEYRNPDTLEKRISKYDDMGDRITKGSELDYDTDSDEGTKETREEEEGITVKAREEGNEDKMDVDSKEMQEEKLEQ